MLKNDDFQAFFCQVFMEKWPQYAPSPYYMHICAWPGTFVDCLGCYQAENMDAIHDLRLFRPQTLTVWILTYETKVS